jgi:hypothetical protein
MQQWLLLDSKLLWEENSDGSDSGSLRRSWHANASPDAGATCVAGFDGVGPAWSRRRLGWSYWAAKWMDPQRAETSIFARSFVSDRSVNTASSTMTGPQPTSTASRPRPRFFAVGTAGHGRQLRTMIYVVTYRFRSCSYLATRWRGCLCCRMFSSQCLTGRQTDFGSALISLVFS